MHPSGKEGKNEFGRSSGVVNDQLFVMSNHFRPSLDASNYIKASVYGLNEGKKFEYDDLKEHMRTHTNETPYNYEQAMRIKVISPNPPTHVCKGRNV